MSEAASPSAPVDTGPIIRWLLSRSLVATPVDQLMRGLRDRLEAQGLPLLRLHVSTTTLHPQFDSFAVNLYREGTSQQENFLRGNREDAPFRNSPLYDFLEQVTEAYGHLSEIPEGTDAVAMDRYRLNVGQGLNKFEVLREFAAMGGTDYVLTAAVFGNRGTLPQGLETGMLMTWLTDRPEGYLESDLEVLKDISLAFAVACRPALLLEIGDTILATYLGRDVGGRVMSGEIVRGNVETVNAAIVIADLRGFTALADRLPRDELVHMLDDYLMCMADPVEVRGGQVLKFLGDGLLATFSCEGIDDPSPMCRKTIEAALDMQDRVAALNARREREGRPVMALDIALHLGEVLYGNVGSEKRLDFTVVGPAVNEASRMEAMCQSLDQSIVLSRDFVRMSARSCPPEFHFRSLGEHYLRGVREPKELFTVEVGDTAATG